MNLNQLRFVQAVDKTCSFSQAAELCCVTQPTLSNGIAQFEDELGGRVFERTTRMVKLTPFGEHVLPLVEAVLSAREELAKGAASYLNPEQKLIRIGLSPLIDTRRLTSVLEPFRREQLNVDIFFKECYLGDLDERLNNEKIDIAFRPKLQSRPWNIDWESTCFYTEDLYYLPKSTTPSADDSEGPVRLETVMNETYVLTPDVCELAAATHELFTTHGFDLKVYPGQALSYQVLQDWAELGIGAAILPMSKISSENVDKARPVLLYSGKPATIQQEAIWKKNASYAPHVAELHHHFRNIVPELIQGYAA
jgi:DNA-binding transcriptional LysR family regulator